jgi:lysyl-tRNA synthetase, class II
VSGSGASDAEAAGQQAGTDGALADLLAAEALPEQVRVRREKLEHLREAGIEPYPVHAPRTATLAEVRAAHPDLAPDTRTGVTVSVAGRIMLKRDGGKLCFATVRDGSGDLQVMLSLADVGEESLGLWKRLVDLGDHVSVTGEVLTSRKGELSVAATDWQLAAKSLRPLPEKHKGLTDPEARARMRYVDLIVRPEARSAAHLRATVVRSVRDSLHRRGFLEAETPILQLIHGGANARPFRTHINAYDLDVYLRIATELHLKRLLVGGIERVFEVGRQFRNEGADSSHNPEFTSLEVYQAYADYQDMRVLTQELIQEAATAAFGAPVARRLQPDGSIEEFDLSGEWRHVTVLDAVSEALGEHLHADTTMEALRAHADRIGLAVEPGWSWGVLLEKLYEELCEDSTTLPTFYMDFPKEIAPLTKAHRADPRFAEKWDLVCWGAEQATAYSELNDPVDQRERFYHQSLLAAAGDPEAMVVDEDFLMALEHGMPPAGGQGMGIDRLIMTLTGMNIRETILFPMVKPQEG